LAVVLLALLNFLANLKIRLLNHLERKLSLCGWFSSNYFVIFQVTRLIGGQTLSWKSQDKATLNYGKLKKLNFENIENLQFTFTS